MDPKLWKLTDLVSEAVYSNEIARRVPCMHHVRRYVETGAPVGHFLTAVLSNDLRRSVEHADLSNRPAIPDIVQWLYNYAPAECWGSEDKVNAWQMQNGLTGILARLNSEEAAKEASLRAEQKEGEANGD